MNRCSLSALAALAALGCGVLAAHAAAVPVQNPSFENPVVDTTFLPVGLLTDGWTLSGPGPYVDLGFGPLNSGTGVFPNPASGITHVDNVDGAQLAYIFNVTGHAFEQVLTDSFQPGAQYTLTVAVGNAGAAPAPTDTLELALFYLDPAHPADRPRIASTLILNDAAHALSSTHLNDFSATTPLLDPSSPAVGKSIGILLTTTGGGGGEFVLDNVRLSAVVPEPASLGLLALAAAGALLRRRR